MIMMMLLTMTMKMWPEANLSPDLGRTRQVSGSLRQQMRCFSRPNNPPCTHLISFYQCAMPQIKGKQGTSIWDVYFVWLHKMTGKMSTFELQANMSAKMIIIKVTNGLTWPWPLMSVLAMQWTSSINRGTWSGSGSWSSRGHGRDYGNGQHWRGCHSHSHDHNLGLC